MMHRSSGGLPNARLVPLPRSPMQEDHTAIENMFDEQTMTNGEAWEAFLPQCANYDSETFRATSPSLPQEACASSQLAVPERAEHRVSAGVPETPRAPLPVDLRTIDLTTFWTHKDLQRRAALNMAEAQRTYYDYNRYY